MKPSKYLFFPIRNGEWMRDSQGRPRFYKTAAGALRNLESRNYDAVQVYECIDEMSREEFKILIIGEEDND